MRFFERLTASGWIRDPKLFQRWRRDQAFVDIVPTSQEDLLAGVVYLEDDVELSVIGFDLAYSECDPVSITPSATVSVPRLHALVLTKMIAWMDRPNDRAKDLGDIIYILDNALPSDDDLRWDPQSPIVRENLNYDDQSAFSVGFRLGRVAEPPHLHWARRFSDRMRDEDSTAFAQLVRASRYIGDNIEERLRARLTAFELGLDRGAGPLLEAEKAPEPLRARAPLIAGVPPVPRVTQPLGGRESLQQLIHDAIDQRRVLHFYYQGHLRIAEPHVLGMKNGRLHVLTYQIGGRSSSGSLPDWRRFFVSELRDVKIVEQTFVPQSWGFGRHSAFDRQIAVVRRGA